MDFRKQLRIIRKERRITQKGIGKEIGITREVICGFENYHHGLNLLTLLKYIKALDCKLIIVKNEYIEREESDLDPL